MLVTLALLLSILATISLLAWLFILFHPARPWDFWPVAEDLPLPEISDPLPSTVIVVPARNEADSLPATLPALLQQDYPDYRVVIVDDRSDDGTAGVARGIAEKMGCAERLTVIEGAALPQGWVGKVWAMTQGVQAALASGDPQFLMLTDADILHAPGSLQRLVRESLSLKLGLNSRMALLRCQSKAEMLLIPAFVYFFNLLYPMRRVNNPNDTLAAAAGGCVLLSREAVEKLGRSFECIKAEIIDDVNLARQVKAHGLPLRLSLSKSDVKSLRDYPLLADIWKMVRRTAFTELKYSYLRLIGAIAGLKLLFGVPVAAVFFGLILLLLDPAGPSAVFAGWAIGKGLLSLLVMRAVYAPAVRFFRLPGYYAYTLPVAGFIYGLMTADSARRFAQGKGVQWRDAQKAMPPGRE
jgi:hopene-associated glycosyltransferase HpnB